MMAYNDDKEFVHYDDDEEMTFQDGQTKAVRRCEAFWHFAVRLHQSDEHYNYHFAEQD